MTFIKTIPIDQAAGLAAEQYTDNQAKIGYVPNYVQALSLHPEVYAAWTQLIGAVRSKMRLRQYELLTFAAAQALECSY